MAELSKAIARLMEERERAQPAAGAPDPPRLRAVIEQVRMRVIPGDRPVAEAFTRQLLERAPDLLDSSDVEVLARIAMAAFAFVGERGVEEPRLRLFDPDLIEGGWDTPGTVVQALMYDRPFIVDTVRECLRQAGCSIRRLLHPIFTIERNGRGALLAVVPAGGPGRRESFVYAEVDRVADPEALAALLTRRLTDVVWATDDYPAMRAKASELAAALRSGSLPRPWNEDAAETAEFLEWLGAKHFVFLGYREYELSGQGFERAAAVRRGSGLGILRSEERSSFASPRVLREELRRRLNEPPLLMVSATNAESPIHRRAHMDDIGLKVIDDTGVVVGEHRFLGLFTARAYAEEPSAVPLLRSKLQAVLALAGVVEDDSHDYRTIVSVFGSLPRVELLGSSVTELHEDIQAIIAAEGRAEVKVLARPDSLARGLFVVVILPRTRFSDELYRRAQSRLAQALSATAVLAQRLAMDDSDQVRMHFYFAISPQSLQAVVPEVLHSEVATLLRTWEDRLQEELQAQFSRDEARTLLARYGAAFTPQYKTATDVGAAVRDIRRLEAARTARVPQVAVCEESAYGVPQSSAIKLYLIEETLVLSDFLPVLENLGLRVLSMDVLDIVLSDVGRVRVHTFFVQNTAGEALEAAVAPLLEPALLLLHSGRIDNDRLNSLMVQARLSWRQVDLLRTYVNHGLQIGSAPSQTALIKALAGHPQSARLLWQYFAAKFDPQQAATPRDRETRVLPELEQRYLASLDAVESVVEDRVLRALLSAVAATVRTNFFRGRPGEGAEPAQTERSALAIKIESGRIPHLRPPQPLYEIHVHAPQVEGVHLRGSRVARGGIRLSERPDDFRTEILDLLRTQMVKNAVIVPGGAKGGFIARRREGAPLTSAHVSTAYRTFIAALLDLTDNIVQGRLTPPPGVVYDDPDPYLVVAPDKGTASLSDSANEVAAQYRFWLGDAFASGGTHGYDHKKEGITARGAWESIRRHFRELGRDVDREPITVIGIGDMSGDVFGNGMLLSRQLCLRAAFNHHHIFLDPNPDPARSFVERERLFRLPRSSWSDYDSSFISGGGGVYPRNAKRVPLSEYARQMLNLTSDSPSGEEVVRAILRMEADLLWNGGIGTYVKASDEAHADADDSSNDSVRVDATELRVKAVAEGGNLGFTQRGRIEYAVRGGRINLDAIDNSGGVDMSDHEVNLKMALSGNVEAGQLSLAERNRLLAELTPEVTQSVLEHNRRQARVLGLDQLRSQTRLVEFRELLAELEAAGQLDRRQARLPDREALRNRRSVFLGLTRPELGLLLAYGKLLLQQRVLASSLPDDGFFEPYLRAYFPEIINQRFGHGVRSHRLRREIVAVELANLVIDTMGATFVTRVGRDTGADAVSIVRAWAVALDVSGARALCEELAHLDPPLPVPAEAACWFVWEAALERATKWIVETQPAEAATADLGSWFGGAVQEVTQTLPHVLPPTRQEALAAAVEDLASQGTPRALAQRLVELDRLAEALEVSHISRHFELPLGTATAAYYQVTEVVDFDWLRQTIAGLPGEDRWERRAVEGLTEGLTYARRQLTQQVLSGLSEGDEVSACLEAYVAAHRPQLDKLHALIDDIKSAPHVTLAAVLVVMRELGRLVGRGE